MSKNKKGKIVPLKPILLSPEKYIKTQARSLPIAECVITQGWEEAGVGNIFVARMHKTGNITVEAYLVDMYCLGLKNTRYEFNITPDDYNSFKHDDYDLVECDYALAHNIIYGGIAFAEDCGFKPHKDFSVSQFILEEDDEHIELMELEFGLNGVPTFIPGPYDDDAKIKKINATLNQVVGPDNFITVDPLDDEEFDYNPEELADDLIEELAKSYAEFPAILKKLNKTYDGLIRLPEIKEKIEKFPVGTSYKIRKGEVKTEYSEFDNGEQEDEFNRLSDIIINSDNYELAIKGLKKAIAKYPDKPLFYESLLTAYNFSKRFDELDEVIREIYKRFPDYLHAMVLYANLLIDEGKADQVLAVFKGKLDLNELYPSRKVFHLTEAIVYYACMCRYFISMDDIDSADLYMNALLKKKFTEIPGQTIAHQAVIELCNAKMKKIDEIANIDLE